MERTGVLVKDGKVVNIVVWGDDSEQQFADDGYDHYEETTDMLSKPGIGWTWNASVGYISPQPYPSWSLKGSTWEAPIAIPNNGGQYEWNEEAQSWDLIPE